MITGENCTFHVNFRPWIITDCVVVAVKIKEREAPVDVSLTWLRLNVLFLDELFGDGLVARDDPYKVYALVEAFQINTVDGFA